MLFSQYEKFRLLQHSGISYNLYKNLLLFLKIIVMDRTLKGLVSMVFFSHGVLTFFGFKHVFQCFDEHSGDLYTENDLTHCSDFGVVGIYLKCCYALLV